jgi:hypothetical protein
MDFAAEYDSNGGDQPYSDEVKQAGRPQKTLAKPRQGDESGSPESKSHGKGGGSPCAARYTNGEGEDHPNQKAQQ